MIIPGLDNEHITMSTTPSSKPSSQQWDLHRLQQIFKWTVYSLLIINFVLYVIDDWGFSQHTLSDTSTLLDKVSAFATSIAVGAWLLLLASFELETYALEDEQFTPVTTRILQAIRLFCAAMIAYTIFAFVDYVVAVYPTAPVEDATSLCEVADQEISFTYNIEYTEITSENCNELSSDTEFFWLDGNDVLTDTKGLALERKLAWGDVTEIFIWIVIIVSMEVVVRLQERGITSGALMTTLNRTKLVGYVLLLALASWWASLGHWLYLWDMVLWIGGFTAIEFNLSEWRDEINEDEKDNVTQAV